MGPAQCGTGTWQEREGEGVSMGELTAQYGKPVVGVQGWHPGFTHSSAMDLGWNLHCHTTPL